jgi:tetratricopeptide (TPR) repeat protein
MISVQEGARKMTVVNKKALDEAQDIMWTAMDLPVRSEGVKLSEKALSICADCADAYVFLAYYREKTSAAKIAMFEQGVKAGLRAIPAFRFKEDVGHFWGIIETRPYMRALYGLAYELEKTGRIDEAIVHYKELLRLNPRDSQGARYLLIPLYIALEKPKKAMALINQYQEDVGPEITYNRTLLLFKQDGDCEKANEALAEAVRSNRHVIPFLLAPKFNSKLPVPAYITVGEKNEAYEYARRCRELWHKAPGAVDWLIEILMASYIDHQKLHV